MSKKAYQRYTQEFKDKAAIFPPSPTRYGQATFASLHSPFGQPTAGCLAALGSTVTAATSMAAASSVNGCASQAWSRACPPEPTLITTPGPNRQQGDRLPQAARRASEASQSFIGTLKAEMLRDGCFASQQDADHELFAFIDSYHNTRRLHCLVTLALRAACGWLSPLRSGSSLNYKSPSLFE